MPATTKLSDREFAAILAGLRLLQLELESGRSINLLQKVWDVLTDAGEVEPLDVEEIDSLCENLNCGPAHLTLPGGKED